MDHVAECPNGGVAAFADGFGFSDWKGGWFFRDFCSCARAAWVADEGGEVLRERGVHHVDEFVFVFWLYGDRVWNHAGVRDVEEAVMGGSVVWRKAGSVHAEYDG